MKRRKEQVEVRTFQFVSVTCAHIPKEMLRATPCWRDRGRERLRIKRKQSKLRKRQDLLKYADYECPKIRWQKTRLRLHSGESIINQQIPLMFISNPVNNSISRIVSHSGHMIFFLTPLIDKDGMNPCLVNFPNSLLARSGLWDIEAHRGNTGCVL